MRKLFFALIIILAPTFAFAEKIDSYAVKANLDENAVINVTETIRYDFGTEQKHGIFRYIPTVYKSRTGSPRQGFTLISVTDELGSPIETKLSNENNNEIIQIGNPDVLVTGVRTYNISYKLSRMVSSDSDGDRFRWDAIGTGWEVPIQNVIITFEKHDGFDTSIITKNCYLGVSGSSDNCEFQEKNNNVYIARDTLPANTGITIDLLYKKGTFPPPSKLEMWFWTSRWYYGLPIISFLVFFILWYEKGRDPRGRGTIVPMYDPPKGMTPYESTILLESMISKKALPAAIISLAVRGYIKIHPKEVKNLFSTSTEYELVKIKGLAAGSSEVDAKVMNLFFTGRDVVNLKELGDSFASLHHELHRTAYKEVTDKGYYVVNPTISRIIFFSISVALAVLGVIFAIYFLADFTKLLFILSPAVISLGFAFIMPALTKEGELLKEDLLGLKMYIKTAELDRIKFHNAPAKTSAKFEELLPYAMIFGLEKEWAEEFKDIYKTAPSWYDGNMTTFSALALTHDLGNFSNAAISSAVASSSSGGSGGFSGGGAGGGGGGSW